MSKQIVPPPSEIEAFLTKLHQNANDVVQNPNQYGLSELQIHKGKKFCNSIKDTLIRMKDLAISLQWQEYTLHGENGSQEEAYETYINRLETAIERFQEQFYTDEYLVTFTILDIFLQNNPERRIIFEHPQKDQATKAFIDNLFDALKSPSSLFEVLINDYQVKSSQQNSIDDTQPTSTAIVRPFPSVK